MNIPRFPAGAAVPEVVDALKSHGCAIIEKLVDRDLLDRARAELQPWLEATPYGHDEFAGRHTRRTGGLLGRSPICRDLVMHPLVLESVRGLLAHATSIQLHLTQVIAIGPGEPAQAIHRDQWAFDFFPFPSGYEATCNTIWAMTDFTAANGGTRVIPGSNQLADRLQFKEGDTVAAEMPAGSVLIYSGSLYHGGGANRSQETRYGVNLTYALSWLRQEENQYLAVPFDVARTFPEPLLRLMGYARGAYALGYVDELRDPLDVLFGRSGAPADMGELEEATRRLRGGL